ncbi:MAG: hypothetical protein EOP88_14610 [Verrucomicrobiaceae bacterium]|nr:MAG: hypothetical protein EOP88_14610 [Verrucomicrobiaceae bacterium]
MKAVLPVFIGALLLGGAVRWASRSGVGDEVSVSPGRGDASASTTRERTAPTPSELMESTRVWVKDSTAMQPNPYHEELAAWTDAEIRAALEESLGNRDFLLDTRDARNLVYGLLAEWVHRDWAAASTWFLTIPEGLRSDEMVLSFGYAWPAAHAAEGLVFVKANPQVFESSSAWSIGLKNIESRAVEGAASVISLIGELREAKVGLGFKETVKFPENFDFATLMRSPEVVELRRNYQGEFLAGAWYAQDREACFGWVKESGALRDLSDIVALGAENPEDGLRWLGSKYEALDAADRKTLMLGTPPGNADIMGKMIAGIGDPRVVEELRASCAEWLFMGEVVGTLEVLGGIRDSATRLQVLEEFEGEKARRFSAMSPGDVEIFRKRLKEWNATPEQAEALVEKYQQRK